MSVVTQGRSPRVSIDGSPTIRSPGGTTVASLMQRALDRQASQRQARFQINSGQISHILANLPKNSGPYRELVNILRDWPLTDENMKVLLEECRECMLMLGLEAHALVQGVCSADWSGREEHMVVLYEAFALDLVTAHNYHTPILLTSLLKLFKTEGDIWEDDPPTELVHRWSNIHCIIAKIVAVMPMSTDLLIQTIVEQFPYHKAGAYSNRTYIYNLIWITKYIPALLEDIMTVIVTRLVTMDLSCTEFTKRQSLDSYVELDEREAALPESMDYCMLEMLRWIVDERGNVLTTLCDVFEKVVLLTHGTRYVQFLLLSAISISQRCTDRVLHNLWSVASGLHSSGLGAVATRRTAAAHLAGLLARCVRIPSTRLVKYLELMARWCHEYAKATQETAGSCDSVKIHGAFHAICHAIFYLVAFKHQQLFASKESINFVESLNLPRLVTCTLNPLRTCPPAVTRAFASVTRSHQVVYCQAVIDKNARHSLQNRTEVNYDDWFPYDPFTLNRSGKIVWPLCIEYREWLNEDGDNTQYSSRVKKLQTEDEDFMSDTPNKVARSLSNCIAPGFKYM